MTFPSLGRRKNGTEGIFKNALYEMFLLSFGLTLARVQLTLQDNGAHRGGL